MIWKHKIAVPLIALSLSAASCVFVYRLPAIYKSEATILVDSQKIPERYVSSTVNTDLTDRLATISQQILSSTALKKIIDDFDLYHGERQTLSFEEIIEKMRKDISITTEKGWSGNRPGAFHVGFSGPEPNVVERVANRLANLFVEENLRTREVQAEGTSEFLLNQLSEAKKRLDELEAQVSRYKVEHNGELPEQENAMIGNLARLQLMLQGDEDALARAHDNKMLLENSLNVTEAIGQAMQSRAADPKEPGAAKDSAPPADDTSRLIAAKEAQLELMQVQFTDNYPEMKALRAEIERLRSIEAKRSTQRTTGSGTAAAAAAPGATAPPRPSSAAALDMARTSQIKAQLKLVDEEIERRTAEEEGIKKQIAGIQTRVDQLPVREQEMAALTRDYQMSKMNYQSLLDKKLSADMAAEMERRQKAERFTILDPARVPAKPYKPNRPLLYGASCAIALALGLAFAIGTELNSGVLLGEWELPAELKVIGRVPLISSPRQSHPEHPPRAFRRWYLGWSLGLLASILICVYLAVGAGWLTLPRIL